MDNSHERNLCDYMTPQGIHVGRHRGPRKWHIFYCANSTPEDYQCVECNFLTNLTIDIQKHFQEGHGQTSVPRNCFECESCDFGTFSKLLFEMHQCRIRSMQNDAYLKNTLTRHIRHNKTLNRHVAARNSRWFQCEHCSHKTKCSNDLKLHAMSKHSILDTNRRLHTALCDYKKVSNSGKKREKTRTKNFTNEEVALLVQEVKKRRQFLFGPTKGPFVTRFNRDKAWEAVVNVINSVAPVRRTLNEIKKKFKDLKSRTKRKAILLHSEMTRTRGGETDAPTLTETETLILSFVDDDSVKGITGGTDTRRSAPATTTQSGAHTDTPILSLTPDMHLNTEFSEDLATHFMINQSQPETDLLQYTTYDTQPSTSAQNIPSQIHTRDDHTTLNPPSIADSSTNWTPAPTINKGKLNTKENALEALCENTADNKKRIKLLEEIKNLLAEEVQLKRRKLELYEKYQKEKIMLKKEELLLLQKKH